jgi:hypothetical protein
VREGAELTRLIARRRDDEGVSLILALIFVVVLSLIVLAGLSDAFTTTQANTDTQGRVRLQYGLDAGISKALTALQADLKSGNPQDCTNSSAGSTQVVQGLPVSYSNGSSPSVNTTCQALAGQAESNNGLTNMNYAIITTSTAGDDLTTQSGVSGSLLIGGSVYMASQIETDGDLKKPVTVCSGSSCPTSASTEADFVGYLQNPTSTCPVSSLTQVTVTDGLLACTQQTPSSVLPVIPSELDLATMTPPSPDMSAVHWDVGSGKSTCRVFLPGLYTSAPTLLPASGKKSGSNLFAGGLYYFNGVHTFNVNSSTVYAGWEDPSPPAPLPMDQGGIPSSDPCSSVSMSTVVSNLTKFTGLPAGFSSSLIWQYGATFVLGGDSSIALQGSGSNSGSLTMFTPTAQFCDPKTMPGKCTQLVLPVNLYTVQSADTGWATWDGVTACNGSSVFVVCNVNTSADMLFNAKLYAANAPVDLFASSPSHEAALDGIVASTIMLQASASAGLSPEVTSISITGNPPPPFRTVCLISTDATGNSAGYDKAVAEIANGSPFAVTVLSWRTQNGGTPTCP